MLILRSLRKGEDLRKMPRDGTKNLIPFSKRNKDEVKRISSKGGTNSGIARRQKRLLRDTLEDYLNSKSSRGKLFQDEITLALISKAMTGDPDAYRTIRDTLGQKPVEKMQAEIELPTFTNDLDE